MNNIKLNCVNCDIEFEKYKGEYNSQIKAGRTKFFCCLNCSVSFQMRQKSINMKELYGSNPKLCRNCSSAILYADRHVKIFCNQSCAATFNNKTRSEKTLIKRQCDFCKSEFEIKKLSDPKRYCNASCRSKESHNQIFSDIENEVYTYKRNKPYKEYLISKHGHKCQMCSITEWGEKPTLLILDHIDGNSDNFGLDNLRVICSNCDTLTPTYKGRNKGKGRFARKQRYHADKSF